MHCCDLNHCMSSIKSSNRLIGVCQKEQVSSFDKRQIPINIDENLIVKFINKIKFSIFIFIFILKHLD